MKVLKRTESELIIGQRGLDTRHWGLLMFILCGGGFTAITLGGNGLPPVMGIVLIVIACLGLLIAIFTGKVLTHRLEKTTGTVRVEYPELFNTRLSVEEFRISDVRAINREKQDVLQQMLTRSTDLPVGKMGYAAVGFSYVLKSGKKVESGIYSSLKEEIEKVIDALSEFMDVPVE